MPRVSVRRCAYAHAAKLAYSRSARSATPCCERTARWASMAASAVRPMLASRTTSGQRRRGRKEGTAGNVEKGEARSAARDKIEWGQKLDNATRVLKV